MKVSKQKTHHIRLSHNKQKSLDFQRQKKKKKKKEKKIQAWRTEGWRVGEEGESPAPQVLRVCVSACVCFLCMGERACVCVCVFCVLTKHLQKIEKERRV